MGDPASIAEQDVLRNELIPRTIENAVRLSSFYRDLYAADGVDVAAIRTIDDLAVLPPVSKERLREAGRSALCVDDSTAIIQLQHTSGTTAIPFVMYRSAAEVQFISEFFGAVLRQEEWGDRPAPMSMQFRNSLHGSLMPIPGRAFVIEGNTGDADAIRRTLHLLAMEFDLPGIENRITAFGGSLSDVEILTAFVLEQRVPTDRFAIRRMNVSGRYLTERWRALIEGTWNATVFDRFSLSEVFGGATSCLVCRGYHFDPLVVPEVADVVTGDAIRAGTGRLLMTGLFPFVQVQPVIRYRTGDIFRVEPDACAAPRFEFLGRENHSLFSPLEPGRLLIGGRDLFEAADVLPVVARGEEPALPLADKRAIRQPTVRGTWQRTGERVELTLDIETVSQMTLYPRDTERLRESVFESLTARSAALREDLAGGGVSLSIRFVPLGSLGDVDRIAPIWRAV